MSDGLSSDAYLRKAVESVAGAESEHGNRRFNNSANRSYYAIIQSAIAALIQAGIGPSASGRWDHDVVQAQFIGELVNRRHRYPTELRDTFERLQRLRHTADYRTIDVNESQAERAARRARASVETIQQGGRT